MTERDLGEIKTEIDHLYDEIRDMNKDRVNQDQVDKVNQQLQELTSAISSWEQQNKREWEKYHKAVEEQSDGDTPPPPPDMADGGDSKKVARHQQYVSSIVSALIGYVSGLHLDKWFPP